MKSDTCQRCCELFVRKQGFNFLLRLATLGAINRDIEFSVNASNY
jgi:hypothetical protein